MYLTGLEIGQRENMEDSLKCQTAEVIHLKAGIRNQSYYSWDEIGG
jgi:hypothetical protein